MAHMTKAIGAAIVIGLAGFGTAQADEMAKTRAEVNAETMQAAEQGTLDNYTEGSTNVDPMATADVGKSRAEVVNETLAAEAQGELNQTSQAAPPAAVNDELVSTQSREEVHQRAVQATQHEGLSQGQHSEE